MQFLGFCRKGLASQVSLANWRSAILVVATAILFASFAPAAQAGPKFAAITVDARNGKLLFSENPDAIRHPASLTKMMTLYVLFQDLKAGKIKLTTPIRISARAASMAPSKLGVRPGNSITVETAIRALVVKSANDVAAAVAESLGGTELAFAKRMTRTAHSIGMTRSTFVNASGLPNPAQITTARDMATLGLRLMRDFPQYYPYFRTQSFVFNGRTIRGHNRLLGKFEGTDGIKTGYINASGFNLVTSVRRGDKRLVGVVLGGSSGGSRDAYMKKMLSRYFTAAANGKTIAAMAGSSKGAVNPVETAEAAVDDAAMSKAAADASRQKRPKGTLFGHKKAEPGLDAVSQVADASQTATPEEGDTDEDAADSQAPDQPDASEGQTIKQVDVPVPQSGSTAQQVGVTPTVQPSAPKVEEAELVDPSLPSKLPFAVKTAEQQQTDAQQVASIEPEDLWSIQIGSFATKKDARARLQELRKKLPGTLDGKTAQTVAVQKGKTVTYRARFIGFDETTAKDACKQVAKKKSTCSVQGPA
jgi:D-alanyl-D-alanine carboxypeptidase